MDTQNDLVAVDLGPWDLQCGSHKNEGKQPRDRSECSLICLSNVFSLSPPSGVCRERSVRHNNQNLNCSLQGTHHTLTNHHNHTAASSCLAPYGSRNTVTTAAVKIITAQ